MTLPQAAGADAPTSRFDRTWWIAPVVVFVAVIPIAMADTFLMAVGSMATDGCNPGHVPGRPLGSCSPTTRSRYAVINGTAALDFTGTVRVDGRPAGPPAALVIAGSAPCSPPPSS
jgi:hypothetical protein